MNYNLLFKKSGKNSKFFYYSKNVLRLMVPSFFYSKNLQSALNKVDQRKDKEYIFERVNYYNKLDKHIPLPLDSKSLREHTLKGERSVYFFDTREYTRWFAPDLKWQHIAGDVKDLVPYPTIVKARPIVPNNQNSVLLNLNKVRHFIFINDTKPYTDKISKALFRGETDSKSNRQLFVNMFHDHPLCNAGDIGHDVKTLHAEKMTIYQHLDYKFILCLEGNDVASNLKWVMSSNSIAVMPLPSRETWFMEGRLIPNYHFIAIKADYSDFLERINYYIDHPEEALEIIKHAHEFVDQFKDKKREKLISLLVLNKYFNYTN